MSKRGLILGLALAFAVLSITAVAGATSDHAGHARAALRDRVMHALARVDGGSQGARAAGRHTRLLGELPLDPITGDVWVHGSFAYVGSWEEPCGLGVRIVDVSDPAHPQQVAVAAAYQHTSEEDVQVLSVSTPTFTGDLLAVGLQACDEEGLAGLDLWDVTDPANPTHLGRYDNFGVHELSLVQRADGVFALLASPFSEPVSDLFFGFVLGDFQLVDVSDPTNPVLTDDWAAHRDGGFPAGAPFFPPPYDCSDPLCRGDFPAIFDHSASPSTDGQTAYLAYWDLGAVILDISDPSNVTYVGRTVYPADSDGDTHSAVANPAGTLLATTDEDFSPIAGTHVPGDTWGFARLWSLADPADPTHLSDVTTPHSLTNSVGGIFSVHNPQFVGSKLYLSWYSDGVRIFDVSNPTTPQEVGFYRPRPHRGALAPHPIPLDWGVHVVGGRIYLSDMFFGLYVLAET
jgi:hypothetical protein